MDAINWHSCFFLFFAMIACCAALAVVLASNIVRMACYLIVSLTAVAGLFFLAGADFLGAAQIMVYVGGTMVLVVFGVMLTARGPFISMKTGGGQWILSILLAASLLAILLQAACCVHDWSAPKPDQPNLAKAEATAGQLGLGLMGVRLERMEQPESKSPQVYSGHLLAFEIISIHLVVVLVGAAYLARAKRKKHSSP